MKVLLTSMKILTNSVNSFQKPLFKYLVAEFRMTFKIPKAASEAKSPKAVYDMYSGKNDQRTARTDFLILLFENLYELVSVFKEASRNLFFSVTRQTITIKIHKVLL
jgi:hypothetical protein